MEGLSAKSELAKACIGIAILTAVLGISLLLEKLIL